MTVHSCACLSSHMHFRCQACQHCAHTHIHTAGAVLVCLACMRDQVVCPNDVTPLLRQMLLSAMHAQGMHDCLAQQPAGI